MERTPPVPVPGPGGAAVLHKGSKASPDIDVMIKEHPCSALYYALETCLGDKDRNWSACQVEVSALKTCNSSSQAKTKS